MRNGLLLKTKVSEVDQLDANQMAAIVGIVEKGSQDKANPEKPLKKALMRSGNKKPPEGGCKLFFKDYF